MCTRRKNKVLTVGKAQNRRGERIGNQDGQNLRRGVEKGKVNSIEGEQRGDEDALTKHLSVTSYRHLSSDL